MAGKGAAASVMDDGRPPSPDDVPDQGAAPTGGARLLHDGLGWILIAVAGGWPLLGMLAPAFSTGLLFTAAIVAALSWLGRSRTRVLGGWGTVAVLAALIAFGLVSALWSIVPVESAGRAGKLAAVLIAAVVLISTARPPVPGLDRALAAGFAFALVLIVVEAATDMAVIKAIRAGLNASVPEYLFFYNRGATIMAMCVWPAVAALMGAGRRWPALACFLAALIGIAVLESAAAKIAIVAGGAVFGVTRLWPTATNRLLIAGVALWIAAAPVLSAQLDPVVMHRIAPQITPSQLHRILIWQFVAEKAWERPLVGWGLGSSRALPGGDADLAETVAGLSLGEGGDTLKSLFEMSIFEQLPLHPHSLTLQVWLELGAVGAALLLAAFAAALAAARWRFAGGDLAACHGLMLTYFVIANLSYGAWQSWWLAALALALTLLRAASRMTAAREVGAVSGPGFPDRGRGIRR